MAGKYALFRDQMIDSLQQPEQAFHIPAPLVQHIIRTIRLLEADESCRPINLRVDGLGRHKLAYVLLRLLLVEIKQLRQTAELYTRVVFGDDAHVVFDDALA